MAKRNVTMRWIEQQTGRMETKHFTDVPNSGSFLAEVMGYATDPIDILEIDHDRPWAGDKQALEDLKAKSATMMREIAEKAH